MGDQQGRPPVRCALQPRQKAARRLGIEAAERFFKDKNRRIPQNGPRDGDTLTLAAGKCLAALAEHRVIPLGQIADEAVGSGGGDLFFRRIKPPICDVVPRRGARRFSSRPMRGRKSA